MKLPVIPAAAPGGFNNLQYEPKSVLELRSSSADDPLDDHFLPNFEDYWDSFMVKSPLPSTLLTFTPPEKAANFIAADDDYYSTISLLDDDENCRLRYEYDYVDELIQLADCFDNPNSLHPAQLLLAHLNHKLRSPAGNPLRRAAFYFKEALQSGGCGSTSRGASDVIKAIEAYQIFSNIFPVSMFSSFTANQAMLEAVDEGGSALVHAIDFDIGFGSHWASFMKELADRGAVQPVLRITALVPDGFGVKSKLIKENLAQFARELNIDFHVDFVLISTFQLLSFEAVKFIDGERVLVLLSPAIFRLVEAHYFAADLRRISPEMVVSVDRDGIVGCGPSSSVRQTVIDGLMFYSTLLESLEAASAGWGGDWMESVENFVVVPKIEEMVGAAGSGGTAWKEAFAAAGFQQVGLSPFADMQANCLVGRMQIGGFHVANKHEEMLLCWHDRALVSTSAWK